MATTDSYKWGGRPVLLQGLKKITRDDGLTEVISKVTDVCETLYFTKASIFLISPGVLSGAFSDSGVNRTIVSYAWTKVSGPVTTVIGSPSATVTTISGLMVGQSAVLKLEIVNDLGEKASTVYTYNQLS